MQTVIIVISFLFLISSVQAYQNRLVGSPLDHLRKVFSMLGLSIMLISCDESGCRDDVVIQQKEIDVEVFRLEEILFKLQTQEDVLTFLNDYPGFSEIFLDAKQYPTDTILAQKVFDLIQNEYIDTLYRESLQAYVDFSPIRQDIETMFGKLLTLYPSLKTPEVQTAVTGLYKDLYISDSLIIIGLDYFIGEGASYTPKNIPDYILRRYDKEHLPGIIAKFMAGSLITSGNKETLLSEMIDFGKTYYLASRLLPCTPDSLLIGYTSAEMELIRENEAIIWANFIQNEILYETSHITKKKFLGERPKVFEINQECPGRIGAWVGWQIVESYMKKNDVPIQMLLEDSDNEKIFSKSGYKPGGG